MLLTLVLSLACLLAATDDRVAPARPVKLTAAAAAAVVAETEKVRADAEAWLRRGPTSYLATIARQDFGDRATLTVGRFPST
ncbi:MAG TPA: hypothetical protein VK886_01110 [Vicinamibacterales bacterium]|nr:hypothetical protein [Vicinamibacterales bacterium]